MPVPVPSNNNGLLPLKQAASFRATGLVQQPIRPHRQSIFHNPDWPPAPERAPPTPAGIRAARARALNSHLSVSHVSLNTSVPQLDHKLARAEQMQARALAAQAAHQKRLAANLAPTGVHAVVTTAAAPDNNNSALRSAFDSDGTPPFLPSTNNAEDSGDLMEEMQVDLALMVDSSPEFTSPSATVDISAFMPAPGPPVLIANDATIAASAVPLSDWAADLTWALVNRLINPFTADYSSWNDQLANQTGFNRDNNTPQAVRAFANATLSATLPSSQCLFLGLLYISKLPVGRVQAIPPELNTTSTPPGVLVLFQNLSFTAWSGREAVLRKALYGAEMNANGIEASVHVAKLIFSLALMLGNKWLEDNTFTTKTWSEVTSLPQANLKALEMAAVEMFGFSMAVRDQEWMDWLRVLRLHTFHLAAHESFSIVPTTTTKVMGRLDELIKMGCTYHQEPSATPDWSMDSPMQVSVALMVDSCEDEDTVLLPVHHTAQRRRGHSRTASLPVSSGVNAAVYADHHHVGYGLAPLDLGLHHRTSDLAYNPYKRHFNPWARGDYADAFQSIAPHPAVVNAGIEARRRAQQQPVYRWDQVLAEKAAEEREQEDVISGWPRPSRLDWSCTTSRPVPTMMGV